MILQTVADHLLVAVAFIDLEVMDFRTACKNSCPNRDLCTTHCVFLIKTSLQCTPFRIERVFFDLWKSLW